LSWHPYTRVRTAALLLAALITPLLAHGQGLAVAPATFDKTYKPGRPLELSFVVANDTNQPVIMQATAMDWWYNDKNEKVFAPPGTYDRSAANWVEFVPRQFTLEPNKRQQVKVLVTPPSSDTPGGHYAILFVESKPELVQPGSATQKALFSNVRLGMLLMLAQENTPLYKIEVSDAALTLPDKNRNLRLDYQVYNRSNAHIFPQPTLAILDSKKQLIGKTQGEVQRYLPEQRHPNSITWPTALAPGSYTAILTVVYGDNQVHTQDFPFTITH
jgi:P pilus assembly chaperone PapD